MTEARERVLVVGAGGLGLLVASRLAADPEIDVAMVVREGTPEVVLMVAGDQSRPRVQLVSDPAEVGQVDWMVVATKAYDVQGLEEWFSAPGCADAVIAVACSGVEALANVVSVAGERRTVVPLVVTSVSERTAPGEVAVRREGVVRVPDDQHGRAFAELAAKSDLSVDATPDFVSATWEKACWDLVGAALSTIVEVPLRELGRRPELRAIATTLVDECSAVAESEGAVLEVGFADTMLAALKSSPKVVRSPMLLDREGHRRLEHDAIADAVVRAAERHEVATPATRVVADLLRSLSPKARARVLVPTLPRVWCAPTADYSPDAP